jgi:hypothetical protein
VLSGGVDLVNYLGFFTEIEYLAMVNANGGRLDERDKRLKFNMDVYIYTRRDYSHHMLSENRS